MHTSKQTDKEKLENTIHLYGASIDMTLLRCIQCSTTFAPYPPRYKCEKCGGTLRYTYDFEQLKETAFAGPLTFWKFKPLLPEVRNKVTMGEGGTPLHKAERLAKKIGLNVVYLKDETRNPTNSFRDRCAALMVSNALDLKYDSAICASNGNMGASMAAYCAKSSLTCHIIVPSERNPWRKKQAGIKPQRNSILWLLKPRKPSVMKSWNSLESLTASLFLWEAAEP
jgi:threonine synthase